MGIKSLSTRTVYSEVKIVEKQLRAPGDLFETRYPTIGKLGRVWGFR